jgi:hypothetical protein
MRDSYRPNRYIAPSLRGERSIDAAEQHAREQILREVEKAKAKAKAAAQNQKGGKR